MKQHLVATLASLVTSHFSLLTAAYRSPAHHVVPHHEYDYRGFHPSRQGSGHFGTANRSLIPWDASLPPMDDTMKLSSETSNCNGADGHKSSGFWLPNIAHQGTSPFLADSADYVVYRNVKDFGAVGDGTTDDSAAFNAAITRMLLNVRRISIHRR